jgi:ribosomal-protein-alanine N-acetyltransferase
MAPVKIRGALPFEARPLAELWAACPEAAQWSESGVAAMAGAGTQVLVAVAENEIAGAVAWREPGSEAEILNLAVVPRWRRRGIGRALMEGALQAAAASGVRRFFLEVRESNVGARAFYSGLGFRETGRRRGYYRNPDEDALLLSRTDRQE